LTEAGIASPANVGQGGARQNDLAEGWSSLLDEALQPPNSSTFVAPTVCVPHEQCEVECLSEGEPPEFARSHFGRVQVSAFDCPLESAVCCALAGHR
jgi:hypothetical protein